MYEYTTVFSRYVVTLLYREGWDIFPAQSPNNERRLGGQREVRRRNQWLVVLG